MSSQFFSIASDCVNGLAQNYSYLTSVADYISLHGFTRNAFVSIVNVQFLTSLINVLGRIYPTSLPCKIEEAEVAPACLTAYIAEGLMFGIARLSSSTIDDLKWLYGMSYAARTIPGISWIPGKTGKQVKNIKKIKDRLNICFVIAIGMGVVEAFENQTSDKPLSIILIKDKVEFAVADVLEREIHEAMRDIVWNYLSDPD